MGGGQSNPAPAPEPLIEEWRTIHWGQKDDLQFVKDYQPYNNEVKQLRVLLYGPTGAGKSSFINSVDSVLQGKITHRAATDANSSKSFTIKRQTYKINKEGPGTFYPFAFTDIMGIEGSEQQGVCVEDIRMDIEGHIKDCYKFHPYCEISEDDQYYNKNPTLEDKAHVLVCVINGSTAPILDHESKKKMRHVRRAARDLGIPHLAVLTKIDEACPEVRSNVKNVYKSRRIKEMMEKIHVDLGFALNAIFPVKNYTSEIKTNDDIDSVILCAIKQIIDSGENFVNQLQT